jgi:hypothetical protein
LFGGSQNKILEFLEWGLSVGRRGSEVSKAEGRAKHNTEGSPKEKPEFKAKSSKPSLPILRADEGGLVSSNVFVLGGREVEGEVVATNLECWS